VAKRMKMDMLIKCTTIFANLTSNICKLKSKASKPYIDIHKLVSKVCKPYINIHKLESKVCKPNVNICKLNEEQANMTQYLQTKYFVC
jgi:hypothetical protein